MAICPSCGGSNPEGAATCEHCGSSLARGGPTEVPGFTDRIPDSPDATAGPLGGNGSLSSPYQPAVSYQPVHPYPSYAQTFNRANGLKDRNLALVLEILPGLFGFYGIGRIYAGDTTTGLIWLIGGLVWSALAVIISVVTGGLACFCTIPVNLAAVTIAGYTLYNHSKRHPEIFGSY